VNSPAAQGKVIDTAVSASKSSGLGQQRLFFWAREEWTGSVMTGYGIYAGNSPDNSPDVSASATKVAAAGTGVGSDLRIRTVDISADQIMLVWFDGIKLAGRVINRSSPQPEGPSDRIELWRPAPGSSLIPKHITVAKMTDGFAVAFSAGPDIRIITYDLAGVKKDEKVFSGVGTGAEASVVALPDGRLLVTWSAGDVVKAQFLDPRTAGVNLDGTTDNDHYMGTGFVDVLRGGAGNDTLSGNNGDDVLEGGSGADKLQGGIGFDFATYETADAAVKADLKLGLGTAGDANGDTFSGIEALVGSLYNDELGGDDNDNELRGGGVSGGTDGGDDILDGYKGNDKLLGEGGDDRLYGREGLDTLYGGAGADRLDGGSEADRLEAGSENDTLIGGAGADYLDGGAGDRDIVDYSGSAEAVDVALILLDPTTNIGGDAQGDLISNVEDILGSAFNDRLAGNGVGNRIYGGTGNDTLAGYGGDNDYLDGGTGDHDVVDYTLSADSVDVDLTRIDDSSPTGIGGNAQDDFIRNVEDILGSAFNDRLAGNDVDNTIDGNAGRDSLYGYVGADTLRGGEGDDWLDGGQGNDSLEGGSGVNMAVFSGALSNYTIQRRGAGSYLVSDRSGQDGVDVLKDIQFVEFGGQAYAIDQIITGPNDPNDPNDPTIPDGPPTSIGLSSTSVREYDAAGTLVGTLSATDPTPNESFTYRLLTNADGRFKLVGNQILVADGFRLDHEQAASHRIAVQVADRKGAIYSREFIITVNNVDPETTAGTAGNDVFWGGGADDSLGGGLGNDRLLGQGGADSLVGGEGNDVLGGGAGKDKLTGGKGQDAFLFDTKIVDGRGKPMKALANQHKDQILDFGPKFDSLWFDDAAFSNKTIAKYLKNKGASLDAPVKLKASFFKVGDRAADKDDFFIYNARSKKLYFDVDGSGSKAMVEIASLKLQKGEGATLTAADFFFV
jgi:Ca2+-binding RTX toxin-like protein